MRFAKQASFTCETKAAGPGYPSLMNKIESNGKKQQPLSIAFSAPLK